MTAKRRIRKAMKKSRSKQNVHPQPRPRSESSERSEGRGGSEEKGDPDPEFAEGIVYIDEAPSIRKKRRQQSRKFSLEGGDSTAAIIEINNHAKAKARRQAETLRSSRSPDIPSIVRPPRVEGAGQAAQEVESD